jgi:hypothetical protein
MRRYVPRHKPSSLNALQINRQAEELYPDISVGQDISPDVFMDSIQQDLDQRTGEIQGRRDLGKGTAKLGWTLASKAQKEAIRTKIAGIPGAVKNIPSKLIGNKTVAKGQKAVTAGKAAGAFVKQQAAQLGVGFKSKAAQMAGANTAGIGTGTAAGSVGAAAATVAPILAAIAVAKIFGSTKAGKKWGKFTNKSTKGRFKNVLNPWKWRL